MPPPTPIFDYCSKDDVTSLGISKAALKTVSTEDLDLNIRSTSQVIDSYLAQATFPETITPRYVLPLTLVPGALAECAAVMVAYRLLSRDGFNPNPNVPGHELIRLNYEDKIRWLEGIAAGKVGLAGIVDSRPEDVIDEAIPSVGTPMVITNIMRGWEDGDGGAFTGWRR